MLLQVITNKRIITSNVEALIHTLQGGGSGEGSLTFAEIVPLYFSIMHSQRWNTVTFMFQNFFCSFFCPDLKSHAQPYV